MTAASALAAAGLTSGVLSMVGGFAGAAEPRVGSVIIGVASAVMLAGNVVALRIDRRNREAR